MTRDLVEFLRTQYTQRPDTPGLLAVVDRATYWLDLQAKFPNPHSVQYRRAQYWLGEFGVVLGALVEEFAGQPGYRDEWRTHG